MIDFQLNLIKNLQVFLINIGPIFLKFVSSLLFNFFHRFIYHLPLLIILNLFKLFDLAIRLIWNHFNIFILKNFWQSRRWINSLNLKFDFIFLIILTRNLKLFLFLSVFKFFHLFLRFFFLLRRVSLFSFSFWRWRLFQTFLTTLIN